jgi:nitrate reductase NapE component
LTATSYLRQSDPMSRGQTSEFYRVRRVHPLAVMAVALCQVVGIAAVVRGYNIGETTLSTPSEFTWFWLGMFFLELPLAGLIARRATPPTMRTALLILYGLVSYAPKLLRNPTSPAYHDEFSHWRATNEILSTGKLFRPNPIISIIAQYPGLHAVTAALVHATDLTIWQAATILLVVFHVALVLGLAALGQSLGLGSRTASLMAILYGLNSSFLYFDTQYAYESMAITLVVWTLVAFVRAIRSRSGQAQSAWGALTVVLAAGTVITHHLSTLTLVLIMALVSLAMSVPWLARAEGWVQTAVTAWGLTLISAVAAGAWFHFVAPSTLSYLSPYLGQGFSELMEVVNGSGAARQLFGASLSPWWEQKSAYIVTVLALGLAVGGLLLMRARVKDGRLPPGRRRATFAAFAFIGLVYFPSTVFILSVSGAEGARRSWAFTWIGLSVLVGPAVVWLLDRAARSARKWKRVSLRAGLFAALAVALVGGTAAGLEASYRFPGPFLFGSDARSVTPELLAASKWFSARFGTGNNIVTDRYTGLVFASFGLQNSAFPSAGFPTYDLYLAKSASQIGPSYLISDLTISDYTYLIVDRRMAYELPQLGIYFEPNEPASQFQEQAGKPVFNGRLQKFDTVKWIIKVFQSDNYSIYRLNLPLGNGYQPGPPRLRGKLLQGKFVVKP